MVALSLPEDCWCPECGIHNRAVTSALYAVYDNSLRALCPVCDDERRVLQILKYMYSEAT